MNGAQWVGEHWWLWLVGLLLIVAPKAIRALEKRADELDDAEAAAEDGWRQSGEDNVRTIYRDVGPRDHHLN